jgi:moderate conductance mechanosensitive channel
VVSNHGQVVKTVGDEVLFVTDQQADAAEIPLRLTSPDRNRKGLPALRVGMAAGRVLTRFGGAYGPVVNRAARLTSLARPGTALVDAELAAALRADRRYRLQHLRPGAVRGYQHLRSWALRPRDQGLKPSPGPSHGAVIGANSTAHGGYVVSVSKALDAISEWARGQGLEIVLLIIGAILLTRLITWLRDKITSRIDANARETDALVRSEAAKHRHALAQVITWTTMVVIYCATAVLVAERLGIPLTSLVAPAAVAAVALGFGAQRIVQDLLAGFFIITERQYGFGDLVRLAVPSVPGAMGTVEDVTLRVTTVRTADGEVVITPNGQINQVTNLSRGWARAVVDVPVPATVDVNRVSDLLHKIGEEAYEEPELRQLLLDPPAVMGVQSIDVTQFQIRLVARTLPGMQFDVGRMLRARVAAGLLREGISLPASVETVGTNGVG